jgi:hypothetical protein
MLFYALKAPEINDNILDGQGFSLLSNPRTIKNRRLQGFF